MLSKRRRVLGSTSILPVSSACRLARDSLSVSSVWPTPRRRIPFFPLIVFGPIRGVPSTLDTSQPTPVVEAGFILYTRNVTPTTAATATAAVARAGNRRILQRKKVHRRSGTISGKPGVGESCRNFPSTASSLWISGSGSPDPSHKYSSLFIDGLSSVGLFPASMTRASPVLVHRASGPYLVWRGVARCRDAN